MDYFNNKQDISLDELLALLGAQVVKQHFLEQALAEQEDACNDPYHKYDCRCSCPPDCATCKAVGYVAPYACSEYCEYCKSRPSATEADADADA